MSAIKKIAAIQILSLKPNLSISRAHTLFGSHQKFEVGRLLRNLRKIYHSELLKSDIPPLYNDLTAK